MAGIAHDEHSTSLHRAGSAPAASPVQTSECPRIVYFLASFPALRNTFVVRELDGLLETGLEVKAVVSLLRPEIGVRHDRVERWALRVPPRPSVRACMAAVGWWFLRRPLRVSAVAASIFRVNVVPRHRVRAGIASLLLGAFHARRLRDERSVHIHAHFEIPTDTAWVVHRLTRISFSFTAHTDEAIYVPSFPRNAEVAAFVVTPSHYTGGRIRERVGREVPVHVVRAAIPSTEYPFRPRGIPATGPIRALCVAGLESYKGHAVLLRALAGDHSLDRIRIDIVGDGPIRPDLERLVDELGLRERISFHGALTEGQVQELLSSADIFVLAGITDESGHHDNLPVALMEAMAAGVPAVGSRMCGVPELIADGVTGFLAEPGDVADLRRALGRALESPSILETVMRARSIVEEEFDSSRNARRLARLLCDPDARTSQGDRLQALEAS